MGIPGEERHINIQFQGKNEGQFTVFGIFAAVGGALLILIRGSNTTR